MTSNDLTFTTRPQQTYLFAFQAFPASSTTRYPALFPSVPSVYVNHRLEPRPRLEREIYLRIFRHLSQHDLTAADSGLVCARRELQDVATRGDWRHTGAKREMRMNVIIYLIFVGSLPPPLSVLQVNQYSRPRSFCPLSFSLCLTTPYHDPTAPASPCSTVVPACSPTFTVHRHYFGCKQCSIRGRKRDSGFLGSATIQPDPVLVALAGNEPCFRSDYRCISAIQHLPITVDPGPGLCLTSNLETSDSRNEN